MEKSIDKQKLFEELLKKKGIGAPQGPQLTHRDDPGPFPLSFAQRRIWFLQQFDPQGGAYNDPTALRISGPLDIPVLQKTLNEIVSRHQVLQMNFISEKGQPRQLAGPGRRVEVTVIPLQEPAESDIPKQIQAFVNRAASRPFDLGTGLLVRADLLQVAEDDYALVVNIHHIVLDGWSKGIMLRELMALYRAFSQGQPSPLAALPVQYTDYVRWQRERLTGPFFDTQLQYWKKQLTGAPPLLELPADFPRPGLPSGRGSIEPFSISREKFRALNERARQADVTLFMLLVSAFNTLLFRYSGQEDMLIGTPLAGRDRVELENLIGLFVNTLVLRTDLSGQPAFKELLQRVRQTALQAYSHQDMPFEKLVEELNPQRNLSITPIFQVMFQLQNAPMPPAHISGLTITPIQIDTGFAQVDLSLTLWEQEDAMMGTFEYSTDLFQSGTIRRMIGHFQVLLDAILDNLEQPIVSFSLLTAAESRQILVDWNDTGADYPADSCIHRLFDGCARQHGQEVAVMTGEQRLTYEQLNRQANRLARFLEKSSIGPDSLVAICLDNSLDLVTGVMAILKTGAGYIPMDPDYPDKRLLTILKDACPGVLISQAAYRPRFTGFAGQVICLAEEWPVIDRESPDDEDSPCLPGHVGCVIFTSGTTGEPRGILLENRSIVNLITSFIHSYEPGPKDRILPLTSIASASFVGEILPILAAGGAVVLANRVLFLDMKKLFAFLDDFRITILSTVPSMIARLNAASGKPRYLRLLLSGGEALSAGDIDRLADTVTIVNGYGLTEATICSTFVIVNQAKIDFSRNPIISVGSPIINTQVFILDKQGNPVPVGIPGEIFIAGVGLSRGYLNNPELTAEKFTNLTPGPSPTGRGVARLYKTGDVGAWLPDGAIKFIGRLDTQVQIHGYRIELSEIETHLGLHPDIQEAVVVAHPVAPGDKRLVAYLVPRGDQDGRIIPPTDSQLRDWLTRRIPDYMIPALFEIIDHIPLNVNGKVDVKALPNPSFDRPELDVDYKAPQTEKERAVAAVWQEFLHLERIGINDNFFDLGGHSLLLTQVHSRLSEMYAEKKELTIVDLFRFPTIHSLAGYIDEDEKKGGQDPADSRQRIQSRAEKQRQAFSRKPIKGPGSRPVRP